MRIAKLLLLPLILGAIAATTYSCGDDSGSTTKILTTVGGAGLGAYAGYKLAPSSQSTLGAVAGGAAGGGLGYLLGGAIK